MFQTTSDPPSRLKMKTTTLSRAVPTSSDEPEQESFEAVASLEWKQYSTDPAMVTFSGQEPMKMVDLLRKDKMGHYAFHRVFTASDGRDYHWEVLVDRVKLTRHDGSKAPIAGSRPRQFGIIGKKQDAYIEIEDAGMFMQDMILITFVYLQKRVEQQNR